GCSAPEGEAEAHRRRHQRDHHQYLPLRHLPAGARRDPRRGQRLRGGNAMSKSNHAVQMNRRSFVIGTAAVAGGGLALGLSLPVGGARIAQAQAQATAPEVNAWVVIKPDDSVVIRVARSEMGHDTITSLCQPASPALECDWS